jgi:hypothetical protein
VQNWTRCCIKWAFEHAYNRKLSLFKHNLCGKSLLFYNEKFYRPYLLSDWFVDKRLQKFEGALYCSCIKVKYFVILGSGDYVHQYLECFHFMSNNNNRNVS